MIRIFSLLISILIFFACGFTVSGDEAKPSVNARAYVLYCCDSNQVLLENNMNTPMGMASTTKIMTALLALEYLNGSDKVVTFSPEMVAEGSSMYLKVGDKVYLSDLVAGMMTVSGNDAANAVSIAVAGTKEKFVELMNARAKELGMKNTRFSNPSGLPDDEHYSTAYDMALLMAQALKNDRFRELTAKRKIEVKFIHPPSQIVTYTNHNKLLWNYDFCTGGKTGYTTKDGRCLVTCAQKDELGLVAVTLSDPSDWKDHTALYEYGFLHYKAVKPYETHKFFNVSVASSPKDTVKAVPEKKSKLVLKAEDSERLTTSVYLLPIAFAPIERGKPLGKIVCTLDDEVVYSCNLISFESAEYSDVSGFLRFFRKLFR